MSPVPSRAELSAAARLLFFKEGGGQHVSVFSSLSFFSERRERKIMKKKLSLSPSHVRRHSSKPPPRLRKGTGTTAEREGLVICGWGKGQGKKKSRCFF